MVHSFRHHLYEQRLDFAGKDLLSLTGAAREEAKRLIPCLVEPPAMGSATATEESLTAYNGELADEVHEFRDAKQGNLQLRKLMLKAGRVVEVTIGW